MPLSSWLTQTASLERPAGGVSSTGAPKATNYVAITGKTALPCAVWPARTGPASQFAQFTITGDHIIVFAADTTAREGDRFTIGTTHYLVNGAMTFRNPMVSDETLYLIDATVRI